MAVRAFGGLFPRGLEHLAGDIGADHIGRTVLRRPDAVPAASKDEHPLPAKAGSSFCSAGHSPAPSSPCTERFLLPYFRKNKSSYLFSFMMVAFHLGRRVLRRGPRPVSLAAASGQRHCLWKPPPLKRRAKFSFKSLSSTERKRRQRESSRSTAASRVRRVWRRTARRRRNGWAASRWRLRRGSSPK